MRKLVGILLTCGLITACDPSGVETSETRAREPIFDASNGETGLNQGMDEQAAARPGPALEDEIGYGEITGRTTGNGERSDFENFRMSDPGVDVARNVAVDAVNIQTVDRVEMDYNTYIALYRDDVMIADGSAFEGGITLWSTSGDASVVLQLADFCSVNGPDVSTVEVTVTDVPEVFSIAHTFSGEHDCVIFRITNVTEGGATLMASRASLDET